MYSLSILNLKRFMDWGFMFLILAGVSACKIQGPQNTAPVSELEGTWVSDACVLGLKSEEVFSNDTFSFYLVSHTDLSCKTEKSRAAFLSGTFEIAGPASSPAGTMKLNLKASSGKVIYTVYKLTGSSLDLLVNAPAPKDGSSEANRIDILSNSPTTRK